MPLLVYGAFFQASPVMYVVYITFQAGRPSRVGPYAGPSRGVFYELRVARSDVVSLSLSRRNAASESAKKPWFVVRKSSPSFRTGAPHGRPYKTWNIMSKNSFPTNHEPRTTNNKKALAVVPPLLPNLGHLCLAVYLHIIRSRDSA